jgi:pSer/pThr/pTyr-binding forkhead associated (FHA) protein
LDTEILIGRSSDLDMVLVEDMVSRQHSRITTHGGEFFIEDLGSTNGTFVNGEKVSKKRIKEGDRILVGTSIIKLVTSAEGNENTSPDIRDLPDEAYQTPPSMPAVSTRHGGTTITGSISGLIDEVPLPDLLQLFSTSKKSGVLIINSKGHVGEVFLRDGRVYQTKIDNAPEISSFKAFYRMLDWRTGTFSLDHPSAQVFEEELDISTEALLMEGMRQLDEIANLGSAVPALDKNLKFNKPLIPPLRSLTPELLDTMQLVQNCTQVEAILNTSLASDFETFQDLVYLIQNDYIGVS